MIMRHVTDDPPHREPTPLSEWQIAAAREHFHHNPQNGAVFVGRWIFRSEV